MATVVDSTINNETDDTEEEVVKDLAYYEANPDEMPTDPEAMAALLAGEAGESPDAGEDADKDAQNETETSGEAAKAESEAKDGDGKDEEPEADVILLKDGKRAIPYKVLDSTRKEVSSLRGELSEKEQQIADLQAQLDQVKDDGSGSKEAAQEAIDSGNLPTTDDGSLDIEALREEYDDDVVDLLVAMQAQVKAAVSKLESRVEEIATKEEQETAKTAAQASQEAIDSIPALAEVQAEGGVRWKAAIVIDDELRNDPKWADKPMVERFREVARQLGLSVADTEKGDVDAGVEKAMKEADQAMPRTISDLEGGEFAGQDEFERLDNLSAVEFASAFEKMSPDKQAEYLARIG